MSKKLLFITVIISLVACASVVPAYFNNPTRHPDYPSKSYLTAVGVSSVSFADAQLKAKGAVAEQIKSEIKSIVKSIERRQKAEG